MSRILPIKVATTAGHLVSTGGARRLPTSMPTCLDGLPLVPAHGTAPICFPMTKSIPCRF